MRKSLLKIVLSSLSWYRKAVVIQILIIAVLSSVITGSLLTGFSVKKSLKTAAFSRMGNTSILISSGLRYFDPGLSEKLAANTGQKMTCLLETEGFCQNFSAGIPSGKVKIYGIGQDFFRFHGNDTISLKRGEAAINNKLARQINVRAGDDIIIRIKEISDIPADAPFSTEKGQGLSLVMRVDMILDDKTVGDFSLGISQIVPSNIFIRLDDLENSTGKKITVNRIISKNTGNQNISFFTSELEKILSPSDIGLALRKSESTGEYEFISNRIFIDSVTIAGIKKLIPSAAPVITYMANTISFRNNQTPYSFVSAIPSGLYQGISKDGIIINRWLASDLGASTGDTIKLSWFAPDSINQLKESSRFFQVIRIADMDSVWGDRTLMPDFPGIAGTESCSQWDAGVPVNTGKIRDKDEDYWKKFKGTPKAFLSYEKGKELWGSNYGPATALRFPANITSGQIGSELKGRLDPVRSGFTVTDIRQAALKAANESVDFGTLFISLGFFIIFSSVLLLSLSVSSYFDNKKDHINTMHAIGFNKRTIRKILFSEVVLIAADGSLAGVVLGLLVNNLIIAALNSVWQGAVQTDTLTASAGIMPLLTGFFASLIIILIFFRIKTGNYLNSLEKKKSGFHKLPSVRTNLILLAGFVTAAISCYAISVFMKDISTQMSFTAAIFVFLTLVLLLRRYYIGGLKHKEDRRSFQGLSRRYYRHNTSNAIAPAIFIAAGIFALFITSLNRRDFDREALDPKGGTGGYLFWIETSVPVTEDISTPAGKINFGLDDNQFKGMSLVQLSRKEGDDASCLNLNHIASPPLLGVDPSIFADKNAFSFATVIKNTVAGSPWKLLNINSSGNTIYGIADQTVLEWGLKIRTGDTIILKAENGQPVNIIIAAGLKSSVFQGNVLIGSENLKRFFPSVSGNSVFLVEGELGLSDLYKSGLGDRFGNYGAIIERAPERLASFYRVTNTYLSVFTVLGAFGMILGVFGLAFVLLRNYNSRKQEFAILSAMGFTIEKIRKSLLTDLITVLGAGIFTGIVSAIFATLPTIQERGNLPLAAMALMIISIFVTGFIILFLTVRKVNNESLVQSLRKE